MINNKKSEAGLVFVLSLIAILFFFGWIINIGGRECKSNNDCSSSQYCGSDFSCHTYPTVTVVQYNFIGPSIIIGLAIIIAVIIFRKSLPNLYESAKKEVDEKSNKKDTTPNAGEGSEIYYKSGGSIKTP